MKVIGHHAVGNHLQPAERRKRHQNLRHLLPTRLIQKLLPTHSPRNAVVYSTPPVLPLNPRQPHPPKLTTSLSTSITLNLSLYLEPAFTWLFIFLGFA